MPLDDYKKPQGGNPVPESTETTAEGQDLSHPATMGERLPTFLFGAAFFAIGSFFMWMMVLQPLMKAESAKTWPNVSAVVESSKVETHRGSKGSTTYGAEILYKYQWEGRTLKSNRWGLMNYTSSDYGAAQRKADENPPGKKLTVYVNPADPYYAVVEREAGGIVWVGVFVMIFPLVGFFIMRSAFAKDLRITPGRRRSSRYR